MFVTLFNWKTLIYEENHLMLNWIISWDKNFLFLTDWFFQLSTTNAFTSHPSTPQPSKESYNSAALLPFLIQVIVDYTVLEANNVIRRSHKKSFIKISCFTSSSQIWKHRWHIWTS